MTNIIQNSNINEVHFNIDKAYEIIEAHLPENYTEEVLKRSSDRTLTKGIIRNLRYRITKYPSTRIPILNIMVEIALEHKREKERLANLVNNR